jgi:hypothetical protein
MRQARWLGLFQEYGAYVDYWAELYFEQIWVSPTSNRGAQITSKSLVKLIVVADSLKNSFKRRRPTHTGRRA